jgi:serine/threonine-protein kinase
MGSVWEAEHVTLHAKVAIKLLDSTMAQTRDGLNRFLREAQAAASLRSPHIVQILDHGVDEGTPYIAMELLEGESLGSRLDRLGSLSPTATARIIFQVARAMKRAHDAGVVHRDLKPDNIFLVPNDDEEIVKVLDFGIAKAATPLAASISDSTRTGTMLGTPYYMSPEQVESATNADHRSDIWAMGVIAYQCILGKRPFDGETVGGLFLAICSKEFPVPSQRGAVPPGFDAWFGRACSRDITRRFGSAREAAAELRLVCGEDRNAPISVERESEQPGARFGNTTGQGAAVGVSTPPPSRTPRSHGLQIALAAGLLVLGALAWRVLGSSPTSASVTPTNENSSATHSPATSSAAAVSTELAKTPAAPDAPPAAPSQSASSSPSVVSPPTRGPSVPGARPTAAAPAAKKGKTAAPADVDLGL